MPPAGTRMEVTAGKANPAAIRKTTSVFMFLFDCIGLPLVEMAHRRVIPVMVSPMRAIRVLRIGKARPAITALRHEVEDGVRKSVDQQRRLHAVLGPDDLHLR